MKTKHVIVSQGDEGKLHVQFMRANGACSFTTSYSDFDSHVMWSQIAEWMK